MLRNHKLVQSVKKSLGAVAEATEIFLSHSEDWAHVGWANMGSGMKRSRREVQVQCHLGPGPVYIVASLVAPITGPLCWAGLVPKVQFPPPWRLHDLLWWLGWPMKLWLQRDPHWILCPLRGVQALYVWVLALPFPERWQAAYSEPHSPSLIMGPVPTPSSVSFILFPTACSPLAQAQISCPDLLQAELCLLPNPYVDILTPSTSKRDNIWRSDL